MRTHGFVMLLAIVAFGSGTACTDDIADAPALATSSNALTTAENVDRALGYGTSVVGTPYGWWYSGPLPQAEPMWTAGGPAPSAAFVRARSANCTGLTNLMLRSIGKAIPSDPIAGTGGTGAYGRYYARVAKPFDANATYPAGTLLGRYYRDTFDQGHAAVVLGNGRLLQSFANVRGGASPGVNTTFTVAQSHDGGFYEYAVLPQDWLGGTPGGGVEGGVAEGGDGGAAPTDVGNAPSPGEAPPTAPNPTDDRRRSEADSAPASARDGGGCNTSGGGTGTGLFALAGLALVAGLRARRRLLPKRR